MLKYNCIQSDSNQGAPPIGATLPFEVTKVTVKYTSYLDLTTPESPAISDWSDNDWSDTAYDANNMTRQKARPMRNVSCPF
jgi:hypothetical protein